jgi:hypothetical protein
MNPDVETTLINANRIKEMVLTALERDGWIKEPSENLCALYVIVLFGHLKKHELLYIAVFKEHLSIHVLFV